MFRGALLDALGRNQGKRKIAADRRSRPLADKLATSKIMSVSWWTGAFRSAAGAASVAGMTPPVLPFIPPASRRSAVSSDSRPALAGIARMASRTSFGCIVASWSRPMADPHSGRGPPRRRVSGRPRGFRAFPRGCARRVRIRKSCLDDVEAFPFHNPSAARLTAPGGKRGECSRCIATGRSARWGRPPFGQPERRELSESLATRPISSNPSTARLNRTHCMAWGCGNASERP